ncbi:MAG TPA: class I tRNA ligase family protein, partial [Verrucomicrobiota bacterium]|nr:class I tRNA ligase family protein [Verrucomicrobiota bacterium]
MTEIPKAYEPQSVEAKWYAFWEQQGCFTADPARVSAARPAYSIVIPPPNVTGVLTLGHVLNNTLQDILARKARMDGKEVLWLPGTDHAGIATQNVVEKALKKEGVIRHRDDLGREAMIARIWEWKEKYGGIILQQLRALGASCDWTRTRFTMDPEYSRCVQQVFVDLYRKGLIYRGKRMVNWCPASLTALSDEEVVMKEQKGFMYYFKVEVVESAEFLGSARASRADSGVAQESSSNKLKLEERASGATPDAATGTVALPGPDGKIWLTIATTRPETIPADTAVAVNPKDPRYRHLIGKHVIRALPLDVPKERRVIPIIADEQVAFDFGTGVLKVTPAHDKADFDIGLRHRLPVIDVLTPDGKMTAEAGIELAGLDRFVARRKAAEVLEAAGALEKAEPYVNNVGFSERADVPIEPRLSEQWFLKYPSVEAARACVANSRSVRVCVLRGDELSGTDRHELRHAALKLAREKGWIGRSFLNQETGWQIQVRRRSLSHSFSSRNTAAIRAVAALPELIHSAVLIRSEPHEPPAPDFKAVHHFMAALRIGGEDFAIPVTVKELANGQLLYDHKAKKIAPGGKPLGPHPLAGKLDIQPAPGAEWKLADLLEAVNGLPLDSMAFQPARWAKVYDHWMGGIQDWCISRQLWWGHRIPVWYRANPGPYDTRKSSEGNLDDNYTVETVCSIDQPPGEGWEQDPDVLDTWFSSWLWPFATMGWTGDKLQDSKNPTLQAFYPTTDLVTGPDIIFFWVARMIMAGHEY